MAIEEERLTDQGPSRRTSRGQRRYRDQQSARPADTMLDENEASPDDEFEDSLGDVSDREFIAMLNARTTASVLPTLPEMPGYHTFWATTSSSTDTIAARKSLGYEPVTPDMIPGWDKANIKTSEIGAVIAVNEMIAMRIPLRRYQLMMAYFHHDQPYEQSGAVRREIDSHREQAKSIGANLTENEGMAAFSEQETRAPRFA